VTSCFLSYTAVDPSDFTTTNPSSTSTSLSSATSTTFPSKHVLPIALGTVLGVFGLLLVALAAWCCRRQKRRPVSEAWTVASHPHPGSPQMTSTMTAPPIHDSTYANNVAYYPHAEGWSPDPRFGPLMPNVGGADEYNAWANAILNTTTPRPHSQSVHRNAPMMYQPNRLSTITETSTPPIGGASPLAHSPASQETDIYYDAEEGGPEHPTSLPSISENRTGPSSYPTQKPHLRRDSRDVATRSQQVYVSTSGVADSSAYRNRPPAYTTNS
jgi:hypothetical protein